MILKKIPETGDTKKFIFNITDILRVQHIKGDGTNERT